MANLKTVSKKSKAQSMGMHTEVLTGRTQQKFFNPDEAENFYYFGTCLLYTSPSPRDDQTSRMPSSA